MFESSQNIVALSVSRVFKKPIEFDDRLQKILFALVVDFLTGDAKVTFVVSSQSQVELHLLAFF